MTIQRYSIRHEGKEVAEVWIELKGQTVIAALRVGDVPPVVAFRVLGPNDTLRFEESMALRLAAVRFSECKDRWREKENLARLAVRSMSGTVYDWHATLIHDGFTVGPVEPAHAVAPEPKPAQRCATCSHWTARHELDRDRRVCAAMTVGHYTHIAHKNEGATCAEWTPKPPAESPATLALDVLRDRADAMESALRKLREDIDRATVAQVTRETTP